LESKLERLTGIKLQCDGQVSDVDLLPQVDLSGT
jgi:hypothetical protein